MQTNISPEHLAESDVRIAETILRTCVHCGFCNATCPTYQLTGTELEGPRGRIYLIKSVLEDAIALKPSVVSHLDNCLSCLACETTCPSGVRYGHLIDAARQRITAAGKRPLAERLQRWALARLLPNVPLSRLAMRLGAPAKLIAPLLPLRLRAMLRQSPIWLPRRSRLARPGVKAAQGQRRARALLLTGCVQSIMGPHINDASIRLLTRLGCEVVLPPDQGCCGALPFHMGDTEISLPLMGRLIRTWHAQITAGQIDMIVINTSGCGSVVRDYGHIFRDDAELAAPAAAVAALTVDISEAVARLGLPAAALSATPRLTVAYHDACSLQHGQQVRKPPRELLAQAGFKVAEVAEGHLCCGSAGPYHLLRPETGAALGQRKAGHIEALQPDVVATGNIGCMEQIGGHTRIPVVHTAELLDWATGGPKPRRL